MKLLHVQNRIGELMSIFVTQIEGITATGRTDLNRVSETILVPLFAEVYGYRGIKNLNSTDKMNYPGIDLGDEQAGVAFQVTATAGNKKIKETLKKFVQHELYKKYNRLIIYILTQKQRSYSGQGYAKLIQGKFVFKEATDIWDYTDVLKEVESFQIDRAQKVLSILEKNFGEGSKPPIEQIEPESQAVAVADHRAQALKNYLVALCNSCEELPYITLPGKPLPPLSALYIPQLSEQRYEEIRYTQSLETQRTEPQVETLEQALGHHRHLLLEGAPGVGKSAQLSYLALTIAEGYLKEQKSLLIPVRVYARGLITRIGSLSESLSEEVAAELGKRLLSPLPSDFFASAPFPGATWLILLDGLDEVIGQRAREELIQVIASHVTGETPYYRFVITTRPFAEVKHLIHLGVGHYFLRPFEPAQVVTFAQRWFALRSGAQPGEAERFLHQVERSRITDLARVPLLLTMAAVIYERDLSKPLPTRRAGLYERFVNILLEDEEAERETREPFRQQWDRRYGHEGKEWADSLFNYRRRLLEHVALWQQEGNDGSLGREAIRHVCQQGWLPRPVDMEWLYGQMRTLLQRTGLHIERGDEEFFIHATFREYLAASALARQYRSDEEQAWTYVDRWGKESWREVVLFLLGIWGEKEQDVTLLIQRIRKSGENGVLFAGATLAEGAVVTPELEADIVEELFRQAKATGPEIADFFKQPSPLEVLGTLQGREQVTKELLALGHDLRVSAAGRLAAAESLKKLNYLGDAVSILLAVASYPIADQEWASVMAENDLQALGRFDELMSIVHNQKADERIRGLAIYGVGKLGGRESLRALVCDSKADKNVRLSAAKMLGEIHRGNELKTLACDSSIDIAGRVIITEAMGALDQKGDLIALLSQARLERDVRVGAATALRLLGRTNDLRALAHSKRLDNEGRTIASLVLKRTV